MKGVQPQNTRAISAGTRRQACRRVPAVPLHYPQGGVHSLALHPFSLTHFPLAICPFGLSFPFSNLMGRLDTVTKEGQPIPDVVASKHGPEITTQPDVVATEKPITCQQAADFLAVHPRTIKRMAGAGELPGHFRFGRWYFYVSELDSWMRTELNSVSHP